MQFIQDLLQTFSLSATNGVDEQNMKSSGETIHERRISICIATKIGPLSNFVSDRGSSIMISDSYTDQQLGCCQQLPSNAAECAVLLVGLPMLWGTAA